MARAAWSAGSLDRAAYRRRTGAGPQRPRNPDHPLARVAMKESMTQREYRICTNCIMDTSDSNIVFDSRGWCDYCVNYHANILPHWQPNTSTEQALAPVIEQMKREGRGKSHDCIIGVSGGVDSSYV